MNPIRVLVVDDSAVVRRILTEKLASEPGIEVVGAAPDPYVARDKILELKPDVLTLDIEMPRMDGLSFLRQLMKHYPLPVIVVSSLTVQGSKQALEAIEIGAVDVVSKPGGPYTVKDVEREIVEKVKIAAKAKIRSRGAAPAAAASVQRLQGICRRQVVVVGASTGGTEALRLMLQPLPPQIPPVVVVQHMPTGFTSAFAKRLNDICQLEVKEACDGEPLRPGMVVIAPGDFHTLLRRNGKTFEVMLRKGPKVYHQRPSVDVLFRSAAEVVGAGGVGVILTGMGKDGAEGLMKMHDAGALTLAQDEASCVVFGMPHEAIKMGAVNKVLPIGRMAEGVIDAVAN
ncbi:MAG: chemotaxis response regulator protein-glutamate methylesterase [Pseudomonadota bacterium]